MKQSKLSVYLAETPDGEKIRIYAANDYDAKSQINRIIKRRNSLIANDGNICRNMY